MTGAFAGLARPLAAATAYGVAAAAVLFIGTVGAAREGASPGLFASLQAIGVFIGAAAISHARAHLAAGTISRVATLGAALLCALMAATPAAASVQHAAAFLIGCAIGAGVSLVNMHGAAEAKADREASAVVGVGIAGVIGACAAPLIVQFLEQGGLPAYLAPAAMFALAAACTSSTRGRKRSERTLDRGRWTQAALLTPFLCGFIDNGVLVLAPSQFAAEGAAAWTTTLIAVAAGGGALLMQLVTVRGLEDRAHLHPGGFVAASLAVTALCLTVLAAHPDALIAGSLIFTVSLVMDLTYAAGIVLLIRGSRRAADVGLAISAFALGEVAGPVLSSALEGLGTRAFYLAPALILAAGSAFVWARRPRAAAAAAS